MKWRVLDLFSGIGGFSLGLERTGGFETVAFCELDPYCRKVLARHWPGVPCYEDIWKLTGKRLRADAISVDAIVGGPPCQRTSVAAAISGNRTGESLWPEQHRLIQEIEPKLVIVEQPPGNREWEDAVQDSLEDAGYLPSRHEISAARAGAPHLRRRVFIIAHRDGERLALSGRPKPPSFALFPWTPAERNPWLQDLSESVRVDDGLSAGLDRRERIRALGNAVVPQVVEMIGHAILDAGNARQ